MRVTFINQFYPPDIPPTGTLTADVAHHFAKQGHDVTVIASRGGYAGKNSAQQTFDETGVRVIRIWTPQLGKGSTLKRCVDYAVFYVLTFLKMLTLRRQDVVIALTTPPYIAWAGAVHRMMHRSCKLMLWNMDCYPEVAERAGAMKQGGLLARLMYWANGKLFNRLDRLICLDQAMADLLAPYHRRRDQAGRPLPVSVIPNWEQLKKYPPNQQHEPWPGIQTLGLEDQFTVLYMGNMGFGHGFDAVLNAAEQLKDEPISFVFIGGGKRFKEVENEAKSRGLQQVKTAGYLPWEDVPKAMASAGCALITLRDDMLGVMSPSKVHANLAAGLPVLYVGPRTSNVDQAVTEFDCGLSARHDQADEISAFIRKLSTDPDYRAKLSRHARSAFDQAYNDQATLVQFEKLLTE